jgi:hypothetical protein
LGVAPETNRASNDGALISSEDEEAETQATEYIVQAAIPDANATMTNAPAPETEIPPDETLSMIAAIRIIKFAGLKA